MTGRVAGKIALITGAAQGLGEATARLLAKEGARVALTDINAQGAAMVAESINAERSGTAAAFAHDVTSEENWQRVLAGVEHAFGGLHVLVNNAGIGLTKDLEQITMEEWRRVHAVDLDGVFLGCKHAVALIARTVQDTPLGGSIVNISSIAGIVAGYNMAAYNSAKAAVRLLSKSVALHCAKKGYNIRSNSVHPVFIATPILDPLVVRYGKDEAYAKLARQIPLGRIGEPDDIAYAVLYLASDESKFVTGAELKVDGGISAM
ncbi:MAG: glucose 1-dehydrogenase [Alphaproteobacteria bacterium]|nr:glucose 1-dehydrogenase [Alphaproteobacteria bacterium]MDE2109678.1 glucose 1-dehydrogenase [Alphaproteobacteria bacterium]MDE2492379.1 glucose 1-dehydrogenase [Alphaproteobacteria bacterium]